MKTAIMQYCFNCGAELGVFVKEYGDILACGDKECQREERNAYAEREATFREAAEADGYARYGGGW